MQQIGLFCRGMSQPVSRDFMVAQSALVQHLRFPIPDVGVRASPAMIDVGQADGERVCRHSLQPCRAGGRGSLACHGHTGDAVLAALARCRQTMTTCTVHTHSHAISYTGGWVELGNDATPSVGITSDAVKSTK
jgi:hypothetical protein